MSVRVVQPALDLWSFEARHQRGHIRLPWPDGYGRAAGDLIPAWVCCRCNRVALTWVFLDWSHHCSRQEPCDREFVQSCPDPGGPYDMTAYWVPPS